MFLLIAEGVDFCQAVQIMRRDCVKWRCWFNIFSFLGRCFSILTSRNVKLIS